MAEKITFKFVDLDYQIKAVESTVSLFAGQEKRMGNTMYQTPGAGEVVGRDVISNPRFTIPFTRIESNLKEIQMNNEHLLPDDALDPGYNFTIDMETGTGKTYVYLRTILELNKLYGFTKFIIVVPRIAIQQGVWKSIQQLSDTFKALYDQDRLEECAFIYGSKNLGKLTSFIENPDLSIMIMNKDSFNKAGINIINKEIEGRRTYWQKLRDTHPIVIIDEPQLIEGTEKKKSSSLSQLEDLKPLFTLRYSATHKKPYNMVYKLTSYDAYIQHLVKKIRVKTVYGDVPKDFQYIRYVAFNKDLTAKIELFRKTERGIIKEKFDVKDGASLQELSNGLPQYENMFVMGNPHKLDGLTISRGRIGQLTLFDDKTGDDMWGLTINKGAETLTMVPGDCTYNEKLREPGSTIVRVQIRLAIKNHLDTQFALLEAGHEIKALSLFFIDEVKHVRGDDGKDGIFLKIFDEEYQHIISEKKYQDYFKKYAKLFPEYKDVKNVRDGYFAIDKGGNAVEPEAAGKKGQSELFNEDDYKAKSKEDIERGIDLILRKKEELISFDTSLAFIFSHSALREGWDNPNVFTLCTLKESSNEMAKKQEIGRGLRLPVDIHGNRCHDEDVNKLTVIANAYYEDFAEHLQSDFNDEQDLNKDVATEFEFFETLKKAGIPAEKCTKELAKELKHELQIKGVINSSGKLSPKSQDFLKNLSFKNETLAEHEAAVKKSFITLMREKGTKKIFIENGDLEPEENTPHSYIHEKQFVDLVNELTVRLEKRTFYQINIDEGMFIEEAGRLVSRLLTQKSTTAQITTVTTADVEKDKFGRDKMVIESEDYLADKTPFAWHKITDFQIINYIMDQTRLPRLAIYEILQEVEPAELREYLRMQDILDRVAIELKKLLVEFKSKHVSGYHVIDNYLFDKKELFIPDKIDDDTLKELNLNEAQTFNAYKTKPENRRAIYKYYKTDGKGEKEFAMQLDGDENVLLFTKLHKGGFVIDTPEGDYSPDWAVVYKHDENNVRLYFIVETKIDKDQKDLTDVEKHKIECGKKHFDAVAKSIGKQVNYFYAKTYRDFKEQIINKETNRLQ